MPEHACPKVCVRGSKIKGGPMRIDRIEYRNPDVFLIFLLHSFYLFFCPMQFSFFVDEGLEDILE